MTRIYLVFVTAGFLGGCLLPGQQAAGGVVATGEQLAVVDDVKVWTTTQKEKVGETEYKDSDGHVIATANSYQDKTTTHEMKIWYPVQGKQQLRDEDFFKITGEQNALSQTEALREDGAKWRTRGIVTMGAGIVASIVGYFVPNDIGRTVLVTGGGLAIAGGYYATWHGTNEMNPDSHAVDRSVAERAAQDYNQKLGKGAGVGLSGKF
ncbi:MAG TPA: hypothetical protein VGO00_27725 [Kofleriaceae bacterium]|nr:hypothetical protein [Kofleriaceae bacterium]